MKCVLSQARMLMPRWVQIIISEEFLEKAIVKGITGAVFEEKEQGKYKEAVGTADKSVVYAIVFKTAADAEKAQKLLKDYGIDTEVLSK